MTKQVMNNQKKEIISSAIKNFSDIFYMSGVTDDFTIIKSLASILILMDKHSIVIKENVSNDTPFVIVKAEVESIEYKHKRLHLDWLENNIRNKALVATVSDNDQTSLLCWQNIKSMSNWIKDPVKILQCFEGISEQDNGNLYYLSVLDLAISLISKKQMAGQFTQPVEFAQLASRLIDTKGKSVFNPFSGTMSYATTFADYESYIGIDNDSIISELSKYRIQLAHLEEKTHCVKGDVRNWTYKTFDVIVSTPPVGLSLKLDGESRPIKSDLVCLKSFENTASSNGVLFTVVLPSVLFDSSRFSKEIRQHITEQNYLDAVIELPANLLRPYTSVSLVAIILRKGRSKNDPIKMLNASSLFIEEKRQRNLDVDAICRCLQDNSSEHCVQVSTDDIRKNDYIWSVDKYLNTHEEIFPDGYTVIELKDVVEPLRGERAFINEKGHVVKISDLSSVGADCERSVDSFEKSDDLSGTTKITEPVILLSLIRDLKPTYCEASPESPIFLKSNVLACRVKTFWASPTYICLEISKRSIKPAGVIIPHINRSDVLGLKIAFPSIGDQRSLDEQNNLYIEASESFKLAKAKELGLQSVIESMKAEYINIVRTRKHDMMPYMRELGSVSRLLRVYVEKYGSDLLQSKIASLLSNFESAYSGLSALVDIFSKEEEFGIPEKVNIDKYLLDIRNNHKDEHSGFSVDYYCDDNALKAYGLPCRNVKRKNFSLFNDAISFKAEFSKSQDPAALFVDIAPLDLDRIVSNIINNAVEHGFTNSDRSDYQIDINLSVVPERDMFQIDFSNNGTPLPKGMDKERYGLLGEKAGRTGKTGQGGYIVKSIVEDYKGDYDIFMDGENTIVRILLPISKNND